MLLSSIIATVLLLATSFASALGGSKVFPPRSDNDSLTAENHKYVFDEAKPGNDFFRQPYIRFMVFFRMKPDKEASRQHWKTVHADLTLATANTGVDILRYTQFNQDPASIDMIQPIVEKTGGTILAFDGIAEFHAKDADSIKKFMLRAFDDPKITADIKFFIDESVPLGFMAGYDQVVYGGGTETSGGHHGIWPNDRRFVVEKEE
ncbi:hypothetical protein CC80DRAFT_408402 [Byssothecium circinans]|uniref:EthD domain-containing protein n=1 Tax=Byssothecium circinans TaxID=147558 RepID=A0A6A5UBU5_9PLEO|nr:hypothetical protein CC80DRAFT_408402 [Byssothecium circinans]